MLYVLFRNRVLSHIVSWGLSMLLYTSLAHCCWFWRVSSCTTLFTYPFHPTGGHSQQGHFFFFFITNSASVNVLGHISRYKCVSFSRVYSKKWNYWVGGCAHFQLQLPSCSPKWLYQPYFIKFSFFFFPFPSTVPMHYDCLPTFLHNHSWTLPHGNSPPAHTPHFSCY